MTIIKLFDLLKTQDIKRNVYHYWIIVQKNIIFLSTPYEASADLLMT